MPAVRRTGTDARHGIGTPGSRNRRGDRRGPLFQRDLCHRGQPEVGLESRGLLGLVPGLFADLPRRNHAGGGQGEVQAERNPPEGVERHAPPLPRVQSNLRAPQPGRGPVRRPPRVRHLADPYASEIAAPAFRCKFRRTLWKPSYELFSRGDPFFNVVTHVRVGDINTRHNDTDYFRGFHRAMEDVFSRLPADLNFPRRYIFVYEGSVLPPARRLARRLDLASALTPVPERLRFLAGAVPGALFLAGMDPPHALWHFHRADVVHTTGSSFPYVATIAAEDDRPVVVDGPPKEAKNGGGMWGLARAGHARVGPGGEVGYFDKAMLEGKMRRLGEEKRRAVGEGSATAGNEGIG